MLDRALRSKNLKHPHQVPTKSNQPFFLHPNLNKTNRLRFFILIQKHLTVFNGNPIIHATINLKLYHPLKLRIILIIII